MATTRARRLMKGPTTVLDRASGWRGRNPDDLVASVTRRIFKTLFRRDTPASGSYRFQAPASVAHRGTGDRYLVDALITDGRKKVIVVIHRGTPDLTLVETVATNLFVVDADRAILVAGGVSDDAVLERSDCLGVLLLTVEEGVTGDWAEWMATPVPPPFELRITWSHCRFVFRGTVPDASGVSREQMGSCVLNIRTPFLECPGALGVLRFWTVEQLLWGCADVDAFRRRVVQGGQHERISVGARFEPPLKYKEDARTEHELMLFEASISVSVDRAGRPQQRHLRNCDATPDPDLVVFEFAGVDNEDYGTAETVNLAENGWKVRRRWQRRRFPHAFRRAVVR